MLEYWRHDGKLPEAGAKPPLVQPISKEQRITDELVQSWKPKGKGKPTPPLCDMYGNPVSTGKPMIAPDHPRGHFSDLWHKHGQELENLTKARENGLITTADYLEKSHLQKTAFNNKIKEFSEKKLGIKSKGVEGLLEGTWQRFKYMGKDTRREIAFNAGIAATVGIAGTMMFFNSINTRHKLDQILDHQKTPNER